MSKSKLESDLAWQFRVLGWKEGRDYCREYRFCKDRRFRLDFYFPAHKLGVEVEGGLYRAKSGHRSYSGTVRDICKGNLLTAYGIRLIRVTAEMIKSGEAVRLIEDAMK